MVDVPLRHPVPSRSPPIPARTSSGSSRPPTISSSIFPHAPGREPSRGSFSLGDGSLEPIQDSEPVMAAIPEQIEDPITVPEVPSSLPQPAIQPRRDAPPPLKVSVPDSESVVDSWRRQRSGSGPASAPLESRGQMGDNPSTPLRRLTAIELTHVAQSPMANLNSWLESPQGESQPNSRLNSFISDARSRNGPYSPGRRVCDCI